MNPEAKRNAWDTPQLLECGHALRACAAGRGERHLVPEFNDMRHCEETHRECTSVGLTEAFWVAADRLANFAEFGANRTDGIALGQAQCSGFQLGSDGKPACVPRHFHACADNRASNPLAPALAQMARTTQPTHDTSAQGDTRGRVLRADITAPNLSESQLAGHVWAMNALTEDRVRLLPAVGA